jgi:23S rRNA U2552 (ribose-2'-O)-methylase RlmE/FtsJ
MDLAELALEFAVKHLNPGGSLLVKVFQGSGFQQFLDLVRTHFDRVATRKPMLPVAAAMSCICWRKVGLGKTHDARSVAAAKKDRRD